MKTNNSEYYHISRYLLNAKSYGIKELKSRLKRDLITDELFAIKVSGNVVSYCIPKDMLLRMLDQIIEPKEIVNSTAATLKTRKKNLPASYIHDI